MKAWLRKDLGFVFTFALMGTIAITIGLTNDGFLPVWVRPSGRFEATFHGSWSAGLLVGAWVVLRERAFAMRDYLRHRPVGDGTQHAARLATCAAVLLSWFVLVPAAVWAIEWLFGRMAPAGDLGEVTSVWAAMTPAVTGCAMGVLLAALPVHPVVALVAGGALFMSVFPWIEVGTYGERGHGAGSFASLHLAVAAVLAGAGFPLARLDRDADRPWTASAGTAALVLPVAAMVFGGNLLLAALQQEQLNRFHASLPAVVAQGGEHSLVRRRYVPREGLLVTPVDAQHRAIGPEQARADHEFVFSAQRVSLRDPEINGPRFDTGVHRGIRESWSGPWLDRHGRLCVLDDDIVHGSMRKRMLTKPDGSPFGEAVRIYSPGRRHDQGAAAPDRCWLFEPDGDVLWRLPAAGEAVVAQNVPGGDRLINADDVQQTATSRDRDDEHIDVLIGQQNVYRMVDGTLQPAGEALTRAARPPERAESAASSTRPWRIVDGDPLAMHVVVARRDGSVAFEHVFTAKSVGERMWSASAQVLGALRPPVLGFVSLAVPDRGRLPMFIDPLLAGGRRPLLAVASLLVGLTCAWSMRRRLLRLGAAPRTVRFWVVATALGGPLAMLCGLLFERPRAYARPEPVPAREPLLVVPQPQA